MHGSLDRLSGACMCKRKSMECVHWARSFSPEAVMGVSEYKGPHIHHDSVYNVLTGPELSTPNV